MGQHYVCVTGGRDFGDLDCVLEVLGVLHKFYGEDLRLIHGGAQGADTLAQRVAEQLGVPARAYPAEWTAPCRPECKKGHRLANGSCPAAGNYRNAHMANLLARWRSMGHTVQIVAFPGGRGTLDMTIQGESRGIPVDRIKPGS